MTTLCVYGLYHLGSVTAACMADAGFNVIGLDENKQTITDLNNGNPPLFEPGLAELIKKTIAQKMLSFTTEKASAVSQADVIWVTFDTPVDEDDRADTDFVISRIQSIFPYLKDKAVVLISSQLPVGSVVKLEKAFKAEAKGRNVFFACSPENLRLGKAIEAFKTQARIVVGCAPEAKKLIAPLFAPFCSNIVWMSVASAEMTKHAVNSYLAMCVAWTNEIATLCEQAGADSAEVEQALRQEPRIGKQAYIRAGAAFGGGTLARDVRFLQQMDSKLPLLGSIIASNDQHADWPVRYLQRNLGNLKGVTIAMFGLAYKPGTNSLRRSMSVRWCKKLAEYGAVVRVYDPQVSQWDDAPNNVSLHKNMEEALAGADALIIATECDEFKTLNADTISKKMRKALVLDQGRFLADALANHAPIQYVSVGRS